MRRWFVLIVCSLAMTVQAVVYTPATVPDPKAQGQACYVANPDALLADSDVVWLNSCAARLEDATRVELCVVALESIGDADAFDFTYELFQRWGLGKKGQNTGVLVLFVEQSHDIRIMTGVGIEGVLTDAQCSKIIHDEMTPAFRRGDYGGGLCLGALRIYEICTDGEAPDELRNARSVTNRGQYGPDSDGTVGFVVIGMLLVVTFILLLIIYWASTKRCPKCGKRRAHPTKEQVLIAATYTKAGQGLRTYCCKNCGHTFDSTFVIPRRQRTVVVTGGGRGYGGGSFGGGGSWGGGSTFGGGAGGKW